MPGKIIIEKITGDADFRRACGATLQPGQSSKASWSAMLRAEHSPIRVVTYWVDMIDIPTYVSVHLVRHKVGVEHFVTSNRADRSGNAPETINRMTPVRHLMHINAAALITISRKRLCYLADQRTVAVWTRVRKAMLKVDSAMSRAMRPECVYRNGMCPEMRPCKPGCAAVCDAYSVIATRIVVT